MMLMHRYRVRPTARLRHAVLQLGIIAVASWMAHPARAFESQLQGARGSTPPIWNRVAIETLGVTPAWKEAVERNFVAEGLLPKWDEPGRTVMLANHSLSLQARVDEHGLAVKTGPGAWELKMSLSGWGRAGVGVLQRGEPNGLCTELDGRVVRSWSDGLEEWFVNRADGLEFGATLCRPPMPGDGPVVVMLDLEGLESRSVADQIVLSTASGDVLHVGHLQVHDATGMSIPSRMRAAAGSLLIEVDDADAIYPIVIDPVVRPSSWHVVGTQPHEGVGSAIAAAGDVNNDGYGDVIVGSPFYDVTTDDGVGRADVYLGGPSGLATTPAWTGYGSRPLAAFGLSVAGVGDLDGDGRDDVAIGSPHCSHLGVTALGLVEVYLGSATGLVHWSPNLASAYWHEYGQANDRLFGAAIAPCYINNDTIPDIVIGAPGHTDGFWDTGAAYLYMGATLSSGRSFNVAPSWTYTRPTLDGAELGFAMASGGDVTGDGHQDVLISDPAYHGSTMSERGAVYGFRGRNSFPYLEPAPTFVFTGDDPHERVGHTVAILGDVNGDCIDDFAFGTSNVVNYRPSPSWWDPDFQRVWVFHGQPSVFPDPALPSLLLDMAPSCTGDSPARVARVGDLNADGFADLGLGGGSHACWSSELDPIGQPQRLSYTPGRVRLHLGSFAGIDPAPALELTMDWDDPLTYHDSFGAIADAGDVNDDGLADILVGSPAFTPDPSTLNGIGAAELFLGSDTASPHPVPSGCGFLIAQSDGGAGAVRFDLTSLAGSPPGDPDPTLTWSLEGCGPGTVLTTGIDTATVVMTDPCVTTCDVVLQAARGGCTMTCRHRLTAGLISPIPGVDVGCDVDVDTLGLPTGYFVPACISLTHSDLIETAEPCRPDGLVATVRRTWVATQLGGVETRQVQIIRIFDNGPLIHVPAVLSIVGCLWPPNHVMRTFSASDFSVSATSCSDVKWTFAGCTSDQAVNDTGTGDGDTAPDCQIEDLGDTLLVRSERDGVHESGRNYTVRMRATDECGRWAEADVGLVHVPHDVRSMRCERVQP